MSDIDDPFAPPDGTIVRPRPGAGRRGAAPIRSAPAPSAVLEPEPLQAAMPELPGGGLNPLVGAASAVLILAGQVRGTTSGPDVSGLRRHALDEIHRFEERARAGGIAGEIIVAARYVLCASLDEAVLSTPWGAQSEWAQHPLLVALHRETWGGEKFFEMLDRISQDPARYIDLMELQYLCLAFGFAGKYRVQDRGQDRLTDVQRSLSDRIRRYRETPPSELSVHWRGREDRRNPVIRYVPWWVFGAGVLALLTVMFVVYYSRLATAAAPLHAQLGQVGLGSFSPAAAANAPATGPTLKQLLAPDEEQGLLNVEEQGGRSVVTLAAPDLFASGSAAPNPRYDTLLQHVASALTRVPGRSLVVGHTDDQPVKSLRYPSNFELSRDRAVNIARFLQRSVNPGTLEWNGVGSSQPRYLPESDPKNRARNRRVEIIHIRTSQP